MNEKTRKIVDKLELLIEILIEAGTEKEKWKRCVPKYCQAMKLLRQKADFTDGGICAFQEAIDAFFQDWVSLHGLDGMTNYIHLLGSGHIAEYLFRHRNLYRHSQQGWEAFNALLKSFFFRRTGRGGGRGALRTKLEPIGRWLQRRVLWLCGLKEQELELQKNIHGPLPPSDEEGTHQDEVEEEADNLAELELLCQSITV